MWSQKNRAYNRFLQMQVPCYNAEILNESTKIEFMKMFDLNKMVSNYKSIQAVKSKFRTDIRSNFSYGFWGLEKIVKDISNDDSNIQISAMNTLSQLLLDKLNLQRAISEFDIVRRLQNVLMRRRRQKQKSQKLVPVILQCFVVLTTSLQASLQIAKRPNLINEFYEISKSIENCRRSSYILKNLSEHPQVVDYFIHETYLYYKLCDCLKINLKSFEHRNLLEFFTNFLKVHPQIAIQQGFFELMLTEIPNNQANQQILIKCFALLLNCKEGQKRFEKSDAANVLHRLLLDEQLKTFEFVAQALQSATAGSKITLWKCREFFNLPNVLIQRAHVKNQEFQQIYCLQTIRQITLLIEKYVRCVCAPQIQRLQCNIESVKRAKDKLLILIKSDDPPKKIE